MTGDALGKRLQVSSNSWSLRDAIPVSGAYTAPLKSAGATLWQHPVGQGSFHSGTIRFGYGPSFRYVYDCGKLPGTQWARTLRPIINAYGTQPLDALFISHFDADHINGLAPLLESFGGARRAFLPYLSRPRRLALVVGALEVGMSYGTDLYTFIDNPADWLLKNEVQQIVYVGGPAPRTDSENGVWPRQPASPDGKVGTSDGKPTLVADLSPEPLPEMNVDEGDVLHLAERQSRAGVPRVNFMDHRNPLTLLAGSPGSYGWVFQTYVDPDTETNDAIHEMVRSALPGPHYEALVAGRMTCSEVLRTTKLRRSLTVAYRAAMKASRVGWVDLDRKTAKKQRTDRSRMNRSTMVVFSGPLSWDHQSKHSVSHSLRWDPHHASGAGGDQGWLLLGDAVLRDDDVLSRMCSFLGQTHRNYLAQTLVFTAPHHGSGANFERATLERLQVPPIAVVPAGAKTHYGHPSDDVLRLLRENGVRVAHVYADSGLGFIHTLQVDAVTNAEHESLAEHARQCMDHRLNEFQTLLSRFGWSRKKEVTPLPNPEPPWLQHRRRHSFAGSAARNGQTPKPPQPSSLEPPANFFEFTPRKPLLRAPPLPPWARKPKPLTLWDIITRASWYRGNSGDNTLLDQAWRRYCKAVGGSAHKPEMLNEQTKRFTQEHMAQLENTWWPYCDEPLPLRPPKGPSEGTFRPITAAIEDPARLNVGPCLHFLELHRFAADLRLHAVELYSNRLLTWPEAALVTKLTDLLEHLGTVVLEWRGARVNPQHTRIHSK